MSRGDKTTYELKAKKKVVSAATKLLLLLITMGTQQATGPKTSGNRKYKPSRFSHNGRAKKNGGGK